MARSSKEHGELVLAAILPDRADLLDRAMRKLVSDHFTDNSSKLIYAMMVNFLEVAGAVLTKEAMIDMLSNTKADAGKKLMLEEIYDSLVDRSVADSDFDWSVDQLRELHAERELGDALNEGMEILTQGKEAKGGELIKGQEAARQHVIERLTVIDRQLHIAESPEGNMRDEYEDMMKDYEERKRLRSAGLADGLLFGIPELDRLTGGFQPGELDFGVGYTSCGKTSLFAVQLPWYNVVHQGKNIVIITTETLRPQVRRKLIARHSRHPMFGLPDGLNSRDIKNGTLLPKEEKMLQEIIWDFTHNESYGRCEIIQAPKGSTVAMMEMRANRLQQEFEVDGIVVDYLALASTGRKRQTAREELAGIVVEGKQMATAFNGGKGVPLLSPWQCSRAAWDMAQKLQSYNLSALAETAEAERSADVVISLLEPNPNVGRHVVIKAQCLKNRDGETSDSIMLDVDYATSYFRAQSDAGDLDDLLD